MRDFLNAIMAFIGASSLTDIEYDSINFLNLSAGVFNEACYVELSKVLASRENVSSLLDKLKYFFLSKGVAVTAVVSNAKTNIYIGDVLE